MCLYYPFLKALETAYIRLIGKQYREQKNQLDEIGYSIKMMELMKLLKI
jgi:hypothetical protein